MLPSLFGIEEPKSNLVDFGNLINPNRIEKIWISAHRRYDGKSYNISADITFKNGSDSFQKSFDNCDSLKEAFIKVYDFVSKL